MNREYTINVYIKYNFDGTREWVNIYLDHLEKEGISFPEKREL